MTEMVVGTRVCNRGSDYRFCGFIVAVFRKTSGAVRYVVENDDGVLHIFSDKNLERPTPLSQGEQTP
jgi:hypothetical protein